MRHSIWNSSDVDQLQYETMIRAAQLYRGTGHQAAIYEARETPLV